MKLAVDLSAYSPHKFAGFTQELHNEYTSDEYDNMIKNLLAIIANQKKQINYVERTTLATTLNMLKGKLIAGKI